MLHKLIDTVAAFCGSVPFLLLNAVVFTVWIVVNTLFPAWMHYDSYPFAFLTLSVSLEAIFLSIFVLISQNRQAERDKKHAEEERVRQEKLLEENTDLNREEEKQESEILDILNKQNTEIAALKELLSAKRARK